MMTALTSSLSTTALAAESQHLHLPTPGDHYSAQTGSATMTVIYETARCHERQGGRTKVLVSGGTRRDYAVGECVSAAPTPWLTRQQKLLDLANGWLGRPRRYNISTYEPFIEAVPVDYEGWVLVHNAPAAAEALKLRRPRARVALYAHNVLYRTYARHEVRRLEKVIDRFICVSHFIAGDLQRRLGTPSSKVRVVWNGADTERFHPAGPPTGRPVVLFIGRVVAEKGPQLLVQAARQLAAEGQDFVLRIVGSAGFDATSPVSPFEKELRAMAEPLGAQVEFRPFVERAAVPAQYALASIFCVPSDWDDPCPLTALEGMACGLPMVTSDRGGLPEICAGAACFFSPPGVEQLTAHLKLLLQNPEARLEWSRKARARAEQLTWEHTYLALQEALRT